MNNKQTPTKDRLEQDERFKKIYETIISSPIVSPDEKKKYQDYTT